MVFFFGMPSFDDAPELTSEELAAMRDTVVRARETLAVIVARERAHPQGLIDSRGRLTRSGVNAAAGMLGMPPVTDEEWADISGETGGKAGL
ncbi:hypothetical protein AAH991_12020 [Microbispora sp. ZYX-F-249]|uniref:DUF222 domain-containing protein n=1 Tax=Microbispora maris TaxID=3144104 RepID=A0ABV0AKJ6_9ACTN